MSTFDLGPYRPRPMGEFEPDKEYRYLDIVTYNGGSYICCNNDVIDNVSCIGILPEGESNSELYWMCLAHKGSKGDSPNAYNSYSSILDGNWDYSITDKIFIPDNALTDEISISNIYDGACGIIITRKDLILPSNSMKSIDYNFVDIETSSDYYFYTFTYSNLGGTNEYVYIWHRSIITKSL